MRRLGLSAAVLMLASMGVRQGVAQSVPSQTQGSGIDALPEMTEPDEGAKSKRVDFGQLCGIADIASHSAIGLARSAQGEWSVVTAGKRPGPGANAAARVWHQSNWMVDLHDAPGTVIHTGQMCFAASGQLILQTDDYMDFAHCACLRYTVQSFDESGKLTNHLQRFVSMETGAEIAAPQAARDFPEVFGFRRVEQLPFYSLVKQ